MGLHGCLHGCLNLIPTNVTTSSVPEIALDAEASQPLLEEVAPTIIEELREANAYSSKMLSFYRYKKPTSLYSAAR